MEGTGKPDPARCVDIATKGALRRMIVPGLVAVIMPPVVGFWMGPVALAGALAGATVSGVLLALMIRFAADAVPLNGTRCTSIVIAPPVVLVAVNLSTWARVLAGVVYWVVIAVSQFLDSINGFAMVVMLAPVPQFGG
jgi:hypothetical protein